MLTVSEAAEVLGMSTQRVYRLLHEHRIAGARTTEGWRIDEGSVYRYKPKATGRPLAGVEYPVIGGDGHAVGYVRKDARGWWARAIGCDEWGGPHPRKREAEAAAWTAMWKEVGDE